MIAALRIFEEEERAAGAEARLRRFEEERKQELARVAQYVLHSTKSSLVC